MPWRIDGHYIIACSCDSGCPCNFGDPPTQDFCKGCSLVQIDKGEHDGVRLDGLKCGFASYWPGPIYDGDGVASLYIDERADADQWNALTQIITGNAGGPLFPILDSTYRSRLGPHRVPITITLAGQNISADVEQGKRVQMIFDRFVRTVSSSEFYQVGGPINLYVLNKFSVADPDAGLLNFNFDATCGQHTPVSWRGP
jgi:hypothetical protein